jgi:hypothetical protein
VTLLDNASSSCSVRSVIRVIGRCAHGTFHNTPFVCNYAHGVCRLTYILIFCINYSVSCVLCFISIFLCWLFVHDFLNFFIDDFGGGRFIRRIFGDLLLLDFSLLCGLLHKVFFILLPKNSSTLFSFKKKIIRGSCVSKLIFLDLHFCFHSINFVIFFKHPKNFSVDWNRLFTKKNCWCIRRRMNELVIPRMISNISYSVSLCWIWL